LVLKSLQKLFKKEGCEVATAQSGRDALAMVEKADFDLVIADIRMPELDGIETVRKIKEIRKRSERPEIPVIFITGYSDIEAHATAKELGELILKPFDLEEFLQFVQDYSTKRRVVITGVGVIAPNGIGKDEFWKTTIWQKRRICLLIMSRMQ